MRRLHRVTRASLPLLSIALLWGWPPAAHAEEPPDLALTSVRAVPGMLAMLSAEGTDSSQAGHSVASPKPRQCKPRYMAGPGMGIALGPSAMVLGTMLTASAVAIEGLFGDPERTTSTRAGIAGGSLLLAGGAATLIYSAIKLTRNRKERRRVCTPH